ncbi:TPA: replication/maintenance protein RepL [Campylobacter jejuni]|nr:replication/maintenance protein RepL [Campylobacter jejuni]HEF5091707.1 replication/maintenance protein RepL [Campylobacter jejuni]HEF5372639.1 replication/maintenance protein RepL [Campylobacter jejuni]HEG2250039.1 replication/maintenance protein RepL [Campylobacter jejuni]
MSKISGYHRYFREEIDKETGEVNLIEVDKSFYQDLYNRDFNFMKMFYENFINVLEVYFSGSSFKVSVLKFLFLNADKENSFLLQVQK